MGKSIEISFVVPVFNRPNEVKELLESMCQQRVGGFEVVIVEDGSTSTAEEVCENYSNRLNLKYFFKANSGPGQSRNYGCERASGNYIVFLDSDCILPNRYFEHLCRALDKEYTDAFGGPDAAHPDFTAWQKAINYSMTSFFTTGGIRGKSEKLGKFHPRSFNMGYSREVFEKTGGFSKMRFGEDIDMSIRILELGFTTRLIPEAFVFHKRRSTLRQFFKQVFNSGVARINLYKRHPKTLKLVHFAPSIFVLGTLFFLFLGLFYSPFFFWPLCCHAALLLADSTFRNKSLFIGLLSVLTSYVQLFGYGLGFLWSFWKRIVLQKEEFSAYEKTFYD
ncbi:glycosyltransferase [Marinilongibacter aquaticus]|uniref:glycosyltransferase n=1 Tax=Marinilongibacter aquaticus TaxID=2975157 RepID=UPI0021BD34C1|nr:glycosyltransferase [Marinilongibacter aquaticus]UBM58281.1 glycosyltransferase [Marinilongibacter aquaticus]